MVSEQSPDPSEAPADQAEGEAAAPSPGDDAPETPAPDSGPYPAWGLLVAALSLAIAIWVVRGTVSMRLATTEPVTYIPVGGLILGALAIWRRPRLWPAALVILLLHAGTLAYGLYHFHMSAR